MNKLILAFALAGALAAPAFADTQNQNTTATSAASGQASNEGNNQNITFTSPERSTTNATVNTTNTTVKSGTDRSIVEYQGDYTVKNVPSVNGPNLTTSNDTCMGSTSGSINGAGFGVGIGSTWTDANCKLLKNSRELWNMGMKAAALALLCSDGGNKQALEMTGTKCPQSMTAEERTRAFGAQASMEGVVPSPVVAAKANPSGDPQVASTAPVKGYTGSDPIVLKRMGGYASN